MTENDEIAQLRAEIRADRAAYYAGAPTVTDEEFDAKVERLEELSPEDAVLDEVGTDTIDPKRKVTLETPMRSMHKVKTLPEVTKWLVKNGLPEKVLLIATPKYDGMSQSHNETSKASASRGNGTIGQDCTPHIKHVNGYLPFKHNFLTLGEIIMRRDKFEKYAAEGDANARNTVGGFLQNDEPVAEELADCDFIRYGMVSANHEFATKNEQLEFLNSLQPVKVPYQLLSASELTEEGLKALFMEWSQDYTIDGIILEINDLSYQRRLGRERNGNPAYARAYKGNFEEEKQSPALGKTWKMSKHGNFIPIIQIEPVNLDGALVTNITGNNARWICDMGIEDGVILKVKRSGMVIPKVVGVVNPSKTVTLPTHCTCGHELVWNEKKVHLVCESVECPSQALMRIISFFAILGVDGVGEGVLTTIYDAGYDTIAKILAMSRGDLEQLDRFGKRKAEITHISLHEKLLKIPLAKLQHASGLFRPLGSKKLALLQHFTEVPTTDAVCKIDGFALKSAQAYINGFPLFQAFVKDLPLTYVVVEKKIVVGGALQNMNVVFTGVRRKDIEALITDGGGKIGSGVSGTTTHLVVKTKGSGSSKEVTAIKLKIPILDEAEIEALVKG